MPFRLRIAIAPLAAIMLGTATMADTLHVPDQYPTIQDAVNAALDHDEIVVAPGTYTGTGEAVVDTIGKSLTLRSSGGAEVTIIDGEGVRSGIHMVNGEGNNDDDTDPGEEAMTIIDGFTITNGYAHLGAGIRVEGSSPSIKNCVIRGNYADGTGGGIAFWVNARANVTHCTFQDNRSDYHGAGAFLAASEGSFVQCTFDGNESNVAGGGMALAESSPSLFGCTFRNNYSVEGGGGIVSMNSSNPTLVDNTFCGNGSSQIEGDWTDHGDNSLETDCPACPGDTNDDELVDVNDLLYVIAAYGQAFPNADFDDNGVVNVDDIMILLSQYGLDCP